MAVLILDLIIFCLVVYLSMAGLYHLWLATAYFLTREPESSTSQRLNSFAIIIPAHNEELLISRTCESLLSVDYPQDLREIFMIADNCTDRTEDICHLYPVKVLTRKDKVRAGKGYALEWALEHIRLEDYDAVLIVDADTMVKPSILTELNKMLNQGEQAIQCYIEVPNRSETWFTQLIYLSRTINDLLYHYSKYKLGLSSYLMGTGMCFRSSLLRKNKWTAFTLSEDWEYFAQLIEQGYRIGFAACAVVLQQESSSLKQATSQRLRWASGRFYIVKNLGMKLLLKGIFRRDLVMADASLALLFPNWSLQINLIILTLSASLILPASPFKATSIAFCFGLLAIQGFLVIAGIILSGSSWAMVKAVLISPLFLVWKLIIDLLCITGLYRGTKWIRTERHLPTEPK